MRKSRLSQYKQNKLIELFVAGVTARTAAELVNVNKSTAAYYFHRLRLLIYQNSSHLEMFDGEVEADESYFGGHRKGKRGRGSADKVAVFGILKRGGKVYTVVIENAKRETLFPVDADEIWRRGKDYSGNWTAWEKITVSPAELTAAVESSVPSGAVMHFAMQSAPTGWLKADGSAVSRTQYPVLFAAIGTTFGVGDGRTTFNLPDLRGEFVRGWGDSRGVDRGRAFGCAAVLSAPCSAPASAAIACISLFYRPLQGRRNHVVH